MATPGDGKKKRAGTATDGGAAAKADAAPRADRSKRLLDLVLMLLRARAPVTFREIRASFTSYQTANVEAGLRAFERDKADLLELGVPVRYITPDEDDALEEGGYVVDLKRYRLPEVRLTAEEVSALVLAASVARAVPGDEYARIVDLALKKLAFDMPEQPDTPGEWPPRRSGAAPAGGPAPVLVHFPPQATRQAKELGERFATLEMATRNRKRVKLTYRSASSGQPADREIDPYGLLYREGSWLVVGYCHLRKDVRSFRLDRIVELTPAPKPKTPDFERPAGFDVRAYAARSPWTFVNLGDGETAEEVELEIGPDAAPVANEDFGDGAVRTAQDGGAVRVRFTCMNPDFVAARVLAAKGGITLVRGAGLRARLEREIGSIAARYR